uniref:Protein kinase domain-containing protein n=1 Tax=Physcomitrium patens TaxID=3218 RepID=A0A7I4ALL1_PHYPA
HANESGESFELVFKKDYLYIGMELMQTNLNDMLENTKQTSYVFLIDIIYQIAKGMCYLHDMHIAHRDLKPQNILVNVIEIKVMNKVIQHAIVKVIDFGISKIEVGSNPETTKNEVPYGTVAYMAPEVLKSKFETITMCPFEADVYSFAMVCSKILSKRDPFDGVYKMEAILERIEKGERPKLPSNCNELIELIQECWMLNPLHRPKFANICKRLDLIKKKFLVGIEVANAPYFGESNKNCHQSKRFQPIHNELPLVESSGEEIFGRAQYLSQIRKLCANKVKVLYLVGMGGIGKTTIAKTTLINVKNMYNASCFVECIESGGDCYTTSCNILEQFQVKEKPKDVKEAHKILKSFLTKNKTILVFDNIKNQSQIEDVVPMDDIFASNGSTLIATTRDSNVMKDCGKEIYKINIEELDEETSMKMFITHSCGQKSLPIELVEVGKKIVRACNGLPLSLKVMGAFLREKKRLRCWERALQKLKRGRKLDGDENNSNYKIWKILRVSFDNLKVEEKKMFLDICCFFCNDVCPQGMSKERALRIWVNNQNNILEHEMEFTLNTLIYQSLIKLDKDGIIRVHDQLRDMSRNIVEEEMEYKYTRINCSFIEIPPNLFYKITTLLELDLGGCSNLTMLPNELEYMTSLKILNLQYCESLRSLPNELSNLTSLTTLYMEGCSRLTSLPNELGNLTSLTTLSIGRCSSLTSLPKELDNLTSLTTLSLRRCSSLTSLPNELGNLTSLTTLDISWCSRLTSLPNELGNLTSLTTLNISWCSSLTSLPNELGNLTSLTTLSIGRCSSLTSLPNELGNLTSLTTLNMERCSRLTSLPKELGNLTSLTTLDINWCSSLTSLPNELGNLTSLTILNMMECSSLTSLPNELGNLTSLTTLSIGRCSSLTSLPNELGNLTSLTTLNMERCSRLTSLPKELGNLTSLTTLDINWCSSLTSLPNELGNLTSLTILNMMECSSLTSLPNELGNLTSLTTLNFERCSRLTSLPKELDNLTSLTTLNIKGCTRLTSLPNELGNLTSLTTLNMEGCSSLISLPNELGNLTSLTTLNISWCSSLRSLPNELGNLTSLTILNISWCSSLTSLPNELGNLTSLFFLNTEGCSSLTSLPNELDNLTSLIILNMEGCSSLTSLPNE